MLSAVVRNTIAPVQPLSWTDAILMSFVSLAATIPALGALYIVKSALGINLMAGPSPLHDLLYRLAL